MFLTKSIPISIFFPAGLQTEEIELAAADDDDDNDEDQPLKLKPEVEEELVAPPKKQAKKEPVYPKLADVAEHGKLVNWSFVKTLVYLVLAILSLTVMMAPAKIVPCNSVKYAIAGTICLKPNATYKCFDLNTVQCGSCPNPPFICQILLPPYADPLASLANPPAWGVICMDDSSSKVTGYKQQCVDPKTCPSSDQTKIFVAYLVMTIAYAVAALLELMFAIFAGKMSEYSEEDFDLNAGCMQSLSIAVVKTVPILSLLVYVVILGGIIFANTVNSDSVVTCGTAYTTSGTLSTISESANMYWYIYVIVWVVFGAIGFNVRQTFSLNEFLYSPAEEIVRNGAVIDWDCPQLRYRRDPTEQSPFKRTFQWIMYNIMKCVINCSGLCYYCITQRKNLSA